MLPDANDPTPTRTLQVQERGGWRTLELTPGELFARRGRDGLTLSAESGPDVVLVFNSTANGVLVTPAAAGARINGAPLQRPRPLGRFDLLEIAGALLRSEDPSLPPSQDGWSEMSASPAERGSLPGVQEGETFAGRYQLLGKLGEGGFGVVYRAVDTQLRRHVAIKILLRAEGASLQRFAMEIRATAGLQHPNLITVHDSGIVGAHPYLVMELIEGNTLEALANGGLRPTQAATILRDVTSALAYAHQQGMLHRDIKPQNVLVRTNGEPVLVDFGLVRVADSEAQSRITRSGMRLGTLPYMSPEQSLAGELDERSEVYALGATLYHALTGQYPFMEAGNDIHVAIISRDPVAPTVLRPEVPADLEAIC